MRRTRSDSVAGQALRHSGDVKDKVSSELWINSMLDKANMGKIHSLTDLSAGVRLARIMELAGWGTVTVKQPVGTNTPKGQLVALENLKTILTHMEGLGMHVSSLDPVKLRDGDAQHLLALVRLMQHKHEAEVAKMAVLAEQAALQSSSVVATCGAPLSRVVESGPSELTSQDVTKPTGECVESGEIAASAIDVEFDPPLEEHGVLEHENPKSGGCCSTWCSCLPACCYLDTT